MAQRKRAVMDQKPMEGAEPFAAPSAEAAHAYIAEYEAVQMRRENLLDRRRIARFAVIEAVVIAVYLTVGAFTTVTDSRFIVCLGIFLLWLQLSAERRESIGATAAPGVTISRRRPWSIVAVVLVSIVLIVVYIAVLLEPVPMVLRFLPGLLALIAFGAPAVRALIRSPRIADPVRRRALTWNERIATMAVGAAMSGMILFVLWAQGDLSLISTGALVFMIGYLALWCIGRISSRMPALGAVWAGAQWATFAASAVLLTAVLLVPDAMVGHAVAVAIVAVGILAAFIAASFRSGLDD